MLPANDEDLIFILFSFSGVSAGPTLRVAAVRVERAADGRRGRGQAQGGGRARRAAAGQQEKE